MCEGLKLQPIPDQWILEPDLTGDEVNLKMHGITGFDPERPIQLQDGFYEIERFYHTGVEPVRTFGCLMTETIDGLQVHIFIRHDGESVWYDWYEEDPKRL